MHVSHRHRDQRVPEPQRRLGAAAQPSTRPPTRMACQSLTCAVGCGRATALVRRQSADAGHGCSATLPLSPTPVAAVFTCMHEIQRSGWDQQGTGTFHGQNLVTCKDRPSLWRSCRPTILRRPSFVIGLREFISSGLAVATTLSGRCPC